MAKLRRKVGWGKALAQQRELTPGKVSEIVALKEESAKQRLENLFLFQMKAVKIPMPQRYVKFHPTRKFEWDFVWPSIKFWVEIDGGEWVPNSGHTSGKGINRDREKDCEAFLLGYRGMRFTGSMVKDGTAIKYLETAFNRGLFNGNVHT